MFAYSRHPLEIKETVKLGNKLGKNRIDSRQKKKEKRWWTKTCDFDALCFSYCFLEVFAIFHDSIFFQQHFLFLFGHLHFSYFSGKVKNRKNIEKSRKN